jgi:hypothetical protein
MQKRNPWHAWMLGCLAWFVAGAAWALPPPPQSWQPDIDRLVADDSAHPPPQQGVLFVGSSYRSGCGPRWLRIFRACR